MYVELIRIKGTWREVADSANTTINIESGNKEPSTRWKKRMLLCEHSPIRQLLIKCKWYDLKSWVSVHFVRHKFGIEHWVRTQRTDRTLVNRDDLTQSNFVEHEFEANAQAIINISRKRLCMQASKETREAWQEVLKSIKDIEPELYSVCVPDCIYRGRCYEYRTCGFYYTNPYKKELLKYQNNID